jgi:hypothetical protein
LIVLCADLVQTNRTSESIKGKRKEKKRKVLDIIICIVCEKAVSISDRATPRDWMSELNWKGDESKR